MTKATVIQILVDYSGSMKGEKINKAKSILKNIAPFLLENASLIGAKTFSGDDEKKINYIPSFRMRIPDEKVLYDFINQIKNPNGGTPLTGAIRSVIESFKEIKQIKEFIPKIVLITDGLDTCGGDWNAEIKKAKLEGIDCSIHIVGIELNEESQKLAKETAIQTGGSFFEIPSASTSTEVEIKKILNEFTSSVFETKSKLEFLRHTFYLRQDCQIDFLLPVNLTKKEAERISLFVQSLPF